MILVFISGQSASGKTGVSEHLLHTLRDKAQILNMDDYFREIPPGVDIAQYRADTNFDLPEMVDMELLKKHIDQLQGGETIEKPLFDFNTNKALPEKQKVSPSEVIIIEGIFAQYFYDNHGSDNWATVTVNVATEDYNDIVNRRIERDIEKRSRSKENVIEQERKYVGPGFLKYTARHAHADVYLCNSYQKNGEEQAKALQAEAEKIIPVIEQRMKEKENGTLQSKRKTPNAHLMIAKSHLMAGEERFTNQLNNIFGHYPVFYEVTPEQRNTEQQIMEECNKRIALIHSLRKYTCSIERHKIEFFNRDTTNYHLAKHLAHDLMEFPEMTIKEVLEKMSTTYGAQIKDLNKINSKELKVILKDALDYVASAPMLTLSL
jgi:uridine kinase